MEDPSIKFEEIVEACSSNRRSEEFGERTIRSSEEILKQLREDGCLFIKSVESGSNLRTHRHLDDRIRLQSECVQLTEQVDGEIKEKQRKLDAQWASAVDITVSETLHKEILEIKELSESILKGQESLIEKLSHDVEYFGSILQEDSVRQVEDLAESRRRMTNHLDTMRDTCQTELNNINDALAKDYSTLLDNHAIDFDEMLRHWSECESDILQQLMNNADLWDKDIEETEEEYYHASKFCARKLTDDIQLIEEQVEKLKSNILMNNGILQFNCQVFNIRAEEKAALKIREKRQMSRLNDENGILKQQWQEMQKSHSDTLAKLNKEIAQLIDDNIQLENKFYNMKKASKKKAQSLVDMADENIHKLLKQMCAIDERIFSEVFEYPWPELIPAQLLSESTSRQSSFTVSGDDDESMAKVVNSLEKDLAFLLINSDGSEAQDCARIARFKDKFIKLVSWTSDDDFEDFIHKMSQSSAESRLNDITEYIRQRTQPVNECLASAAPFTGTEAAKQYFLQYQHMIPKSRIDIWNMLSRALVEFERILKDRLILAQDLKKTAQRNQVNYT